MKNSTLTLLVMLLTATVCFAQQDKLHKDTSAYSKSPLYVIKLADGRQAVARGWILFAVDRKHIEFMEIMKSEQAEQQYHERAKNGVIIVGLKQQAGILTLAELLEKYKIKKADRHLPVYIDSNLTSNNVNSFFSPNNIKKVIIAKDKETKTKYISIITDFVVVKPDPNELRIRGKAVSAIK